MCVFFLSAPQMEDPIQLKEEGNKYFQASDYERAAQSYTQAMKLNKDRALQAVLYRNRAACFLKRVRKALGSVPIGLNMLVWLSSGPNLEELQDFPLLPAGCCCLIHTRLFLFSFYHQRDATQSSLLALRRLLLLSPGCPVSGNRA